MTYESATAQPATSVALLDAAEHAFAERGIEHASLRAIMRSAGANPAAVHYHFGSRQALARAVLERTLRPLNQRRLALLAEAEALAHLGGRAIALPELLDALVRPDFEAVAELGRRSPGRGRLIGTIYNQPERFVKALVEEHFEPVAAKFMPHLVAVLPHIEPAELSWRVRWCVFGLLGALLSDDDPDPDPDAGPDTAGLDVDVTVARVVTVTAGALASPQPEPRRQPSPPSGVNRS